MINVGIDSISFYTSHYYLDLKTLAEAHGQPADKYVNSIGQYKMAIPAPDEDIVTMAANAAKRVLQHIDPQEIELLLFATESGIDQSKAAGFYLHQLLGLPSRCRIVELKQACYSATCALHMAMPMLRENPKKKILLIATDIARYDLGTAAEASQGCGAVAMLLSANPRLLTIDPESGFYAEDAMDFWRPNYRREAFVEGKLSCDLYLKALRESWQQYQALSKRNFNDHAGFCYHIPVPRLAEKAHQRLAKLAGLGLLSNEHVNEQMHAALHYSRETGNCYTASVYASLCSLLDNSTQNFSNQRIGIYSYGSGCIGEYFSGVVQPGYQLMLDKNHHQQHLNNRTELSHAEYKAFFTYAYPTDESICVLPKNKTGHYRLARIENHKRYYECAA